MNAPDPAPQGAACPLPADNDGALYLYCLARHGFDLPGVTLGSPLPEMESRGCPPVFLWRFRDVVAVFSRSSLAEFAGPDAEARLQDPTWITQRACWHQQVIESVMRRSPVLPTRFGTLFRSPGSLLGLFAAHYETIVHFLDAVEGHEEWGVSVLVDRQQARKSVLAEGMAAGEYKGLTSPGLRYLRERKLALLLESDLLTRLHRRCDPIGRELRRHAARFCSRDPQRSKLGGDQEEVLLRWAFLVPRSLVSEFLSSADRLSETHRPEGISLRVSGPWPPYSFSPSLERKVAG